MKEPTKEKKSNGIMLSSFLVCCLLVMLFGYISCISKKIVFQALEIATETQHSTLSEVYKRYAVNRLKTHCRPALETNEFRLSSGSS